MCKSVLFPLPDLPKIKAIPVSPKWTVTPRNASTASPLERYVLCKSIPENIQPLLFFLSFLESTITVGG